MRAIYEFLAAQRFVDPDTREEITGLDCVRCIAGSSIGAWNAMFWLTEQIADGSHYGWWRDIRAHQLVEPPQWYFPLKTNFILSNEPWRRNFDILFPAKRFYLKTRRGPHFYFTRTNVGTGQLEFSTDLQVPGPAASEKTLPDLYRRSVRSGELKWVPKADGAVGTTASSIEDVKQAVFTSMDLPPLFERVRGRNLQWYEDGGVVCNIPVQFATAYEECELVFILPLNASFDQPVDHGSIMKRFMRIVDVRQGVIERAALADLHLYNGYNRLLARATGGFAGGAHPAVAGHFHTVTPFIICPKPPLGIGTTEFWKNVEADEAYCMMYEATKEELTQFEFDPQYHDVWMTLVDRDGIVSYQAFR
jgi:predicted acylesterase/phospholipase RssA